MKTFVLSLSLLAMTTGTALAYDENREGDDCNLTGYLCMYKDAERDLDRAIQLRNRHYFYQHRISNRDHKNRLNQLYRHRVGKSLIHVDEQNTIADRKGELQDVPFYDERRAVNKNNFRVSNNSKQNWRRAAIGYYVDGTEGYTSKESMKDGVIKMSEHQVQTKPFWQLTKAKDPQITANTRAQLKQEMKTADRKHNKVVTGKQRMTQRSGDSYNNFYSPYQNYGIYQNPSYLRTLQHLMDQ